MEKWLSEVAAEISVDCLPYPYPMLVEVIGLENTLKVAQRLSGLDLYFRKIDTLLQRKRDELIRRQFTGSNYRDLASKYGLSERWIREIVHGKTAHEQPDLF